MNSNSVLSVLNDFFKVIADETDRKALLCKISEKASDFVGSKFCSIWEYENGEDRLILKGSVPHFKAGIEDYYLTAQTRIPWLAFKNQEMVTVDARPNDISNHPPERDYLRYFDGHRPLMVLPISFRHKAYGIMAFIGDKTDFQFCPDKVDVAKIITTELGHLLFGWNLRLDRLRFLSDFSQNLLKCKDIREIYQLATAETVKWTNSRTSSIFLFNKSGILKREFITGVKNYMDLPVETYKRGQSLTGSTLGNNGPFGIAQICNHVSEDDRIQKSPEAKGYIAAYEKVLSTELGAKEQIQHAITIPINGAHRTFGVLRILNKVDVKTNRLSTEGFTIRDREKLSAIVSLLSIAIANQKKEIKHKKIYEINKLISDKSKEVSEREIVETISKQLTDSSTCYDACIVRAITKRDGRDRPLEIKGSSRTFKNLPGDRHAFKLQAGQGVNGRAFKTQQHQIVEDFEVDPKGHEFMDWVELNGYRSMIAIPFKWGTLSLWTRFKYQFDDYDINFLTHLANSIDNLLENRALVQDLRQKNARMKLLTNVLHILSSTENLNDSLKHVLEHVTEHLMANSGYITLLSKHSDYIHPDYLTGMSPGNFPKLRIGTDGIAGWAYKNKMAYQWPGGEVDHLNIEDINLQPKVKSELTAPLVYDGQVIGLIVVSSDKVDTFSDPGDLRLLKTLAEETALNIQNRRFMEAADRLAKVQFNYMSRKSIAETLAATAAQIMDAPVAWVRLIEAKKNRRVLKTEAVHGLRIRKLAFYNMVEAEDSISWRVVKEAEKVLPHSSDDVDKAEPVLHIVDDISQPNSGFHYTKMAIENDLKSMVSLAIVSSNRVFGVINVLAKRIYEFHDKELAILQNLALSGAIALDNAAFNDRITQEAEFINPTILTSSFIHDSRHTLHDLTSNNDWIYELLPEKQQKSAYAKGLKSAHDANTEYLNKLFKSLIKYAKPGKIIYKPVKLRDVLDLVKYIYARKLERSGIECTVRYEPANKDIVLECDQTRLEQVFFNLINNSIAAIRSKTSRGKITVSVRDNPVTDSIEIQVLDNGRGISPDEQKKIYDPGYTTKANGHGFGLSMCKRIIEEEHGGAMSIASKFGRFTKINIKIQKRRPVT